MSHPSFGASAGIKTTVARGFGLQDRAEQLEVMFINIIVEV